MKKTKWTATIGERTRRGSVVYTERRVYTDELGVKYVRLNGSWFSIGDVKNFSHTYSVKLVNEE